ncbi:MAG TPA: transcription-repair coupling factor [Thermoanaerobaculia bacterium]|nr:transcription-repair coupling factor [Thermoanaerobaculia bacterium]
MVRLPVPAAAWVVELAAEDAGRPALVVVPHEADALAWIEAAQLFAPPGRRDAALYFPGPPLSPYQEAEASLPARAQEAVALDRLLAPGRRPPATLVTTPRALFRRLPPAERFLRAVVAVAPGDEAPVELLAELLAAAGYRRSDLVSEVGDFAVRGFVFDVFPPGASDPVRIELFGDTVESVRRFDAVTQRSEERLDAVRLLPLSPFPAGAEQAAHLAAVLADLAGDRVGPEAAAHLEELRERGGFPGWRSYLPLLAADTRSLGELAAEAGGAAGLLTVAVDPPALAAEVEHHAETVAAEAAARQSHHKLVAPPDALEQPAEEVRRTLDAAAVRIGGLLLGESALARGAADGRVDFAASTTDLFSGQLPRFPQEVATARDRGDRCVVVASPGHRGRIEELLSGRGIEVGAAGCSVVPGELARGFRLPAAGVSIYAEQQLLPRARPQQPARRKVRFGPFVSSLRDLKVGDYVVHQDHGIGQFVALRRVGGGDGQGPLPPALAGFGGGAALDTEVMEIAYAGGKSLLVPLSRLDLIQKFSGIEGTAPRLDTLGGTSWNKTKARVKKSLRDMAGELLKLYAERQIARAPAMPPDTDLLAQFEAAFVYEETPDQLDAIAAVKADLERERPMDRLLCGDVGYGKTEVAMRAAMKVVDAGYQVALLAPTTVLADQHLETFRRRFEGFPVTVEMVSRFRQPKEIEDALARLAAGKVDVLIGTHRLLSKDVRFAKLGLVVVDEEQRFGVAQKERLKQLKKDVHVLAMSATPVPRTLQLSLAGVRDMSVIETPPKNRMAVETAIVPFDAALVREAILYEIERGGQVYYVYNRVETIEDAQAMLKELVPGLRVTVGHGQLPEDELSRRMHAFTAREHDLLLATTIIENGIDIPNVNTMIVHRADRFGLSQLYQLRGRVGRSSQLAYCYLLVPPDRVLSEDARKRLAALREFSDLGAGFRIAARDLEIRGAGNLLGAEQSGHIAAVGIETYLKMLEDTVRELSGEVVAEAPSTAIDLPVPLAIPESYVADPNLRMETYRILVAGEKSAEEVLDELADRFGPPPPEVRTLLEVAAVKRLAESLRVQSIGSQKGELVIRLRQDARIDAERLVAMVEAGDGVAFSPTGVLTVATRGTGLLETARRTLEELAA